MEARNDGEVKAAETREWLSRQHAVDQALIAELQADLKLNRDKIENLEIALATAKRIGAAIGILMASKKLTQDEAFEILRVASQQRQCKLRDIAERVLLTGEPPV